MLKKLFLIIVAVILAILFVGGCSSDNKTYTEPGDVDNPFIGSWRSIDEGSVDATFTAEITDDKIEVMIDLDDMEGIYWVGSMDSISNTDDGLKLVSDGDDDILDSALLGSGLEEKEFYYEDGAITFDFQILGITTEIRMEN